MRAIHSKAILFAVILVAGCQQAIPYDMAPLAAPPHRAGSETVAGRSGAGPAGQTGDTPVITASVSPEMARSIIYNGTLRIVVPDIAAAVRAVQLQAEMVHGYLQELDGHAITIRIPAGSFGTTLAAFERLGEVTGRHVKANDVTEELRDLAIRLENAQEVRKRLMEIIAKTDKIEDTIKLERELERITETIELIKGRLLYMKDQVAFSTIRVEFNSIRPQTPGGLALPFNWVREIADGAVTGVSEPMPDTSRLWARNERFSLPAGFVRYFERDHITEAMSADDVVIKLRRHDNYDGGGLDFWGKLVRRTLVETRAIAVQAESDVKIKDGSAGRWIIGMKDQGTKKQGYLLGIVATKRFVYTFEAWGDQDKVASQRAALEAAFGTLDVKHW